MEVIGARSGRLREDREEDGITKENFKGVKTHFHRHALPKGRV